MNIQKTSKKTNPSYLLLQWCPGIRPPLLGRHTHNFRITPQGLEKTRKRNWKSRSKARAWGEVHREKSTRWLWVFYTQYRGYNSTYNSLSQWTLKKKSLNFIFPTKYVIPKSLKFSHWPSKIRSTITSGVYRENQSLQKLHKNKGWITAVTNL